MDNRAVGILDSGLGGLTVMKEIINSLPSENVIYLGDNGRAPYGTKSKERIIKYAFQAAEFLQSKNVKAIILACNTISAYAYIELKKTIKIPVFEIIDSAAELANETTKNNKIGLIATDATVESNEYIKRLNKINHKLSVKQKACPLFVTFIEEGWWDNKVVQELTKDYLGELIDEGIDTLVLGCTHYPVLDKVIKEVTQNKIQLVNPAHNLTQLFKKYLQLNNLTSQEKKPLYQFYSSGVVEKFKNLGSMILQKDIDIVNYIDLDEI